MRNNVEYEDFGIAPYTVVHQRQHVLVAARIAEEIPDTLLIGEHEPVITLGRGSHPENILEPGILPVLPIERGGDVTYHGPGQLVVYPIIKLKAGRRDLHGYLRVLEEIIILTLRSCGAEGFRVSGKTGVWVREPASGDPRKIASIGVAVKQWVTYHGAALNIQPDMSHYRLIQPCGFSSDTMISLSQLFPGKSWTMGNIKTLISDYLQSWLYSGD